MFRRACLDSAAALVGALLLAWAGIVDARTIDNVARASWTVDGRAASAQSNRVTLTVVPSAPAIETLRRQPGGDRMVMLAPSRCGSPSGTQGPASAASPGAGEVRVGPTDSLHAGEDLLFQVTAPAANLDSASIDVLAVAVTSSGGDRETVEAFETAADSGVFVGAIATARNPPAGASGDCRISVGASEDIVVEAQPAGAARPTASRPVAVLADPFGTVFDSADGTPVDGARVTLIDLASGGPAQVFADDGFTPWPATVVSGQPISDAAGRLYPVAAGAFRFPSVGAGRYRLQVEPPAPYTAPSTATPGHLATLHAADGRAYTLIAASFGGPLELAGATPITADIPLDAPRQPAVLTKTVSRQSAAPGDVAFYTITVRNPDGHVLHGVELTDSAAATLRLRADSIRIDGEPAAGALAVTPDGRGMTVVLGDVPRGAVKRITYAASVRGDAAAGEAVNRAVVRDALGGAVTATAVLRIERETIAARLTVMGRITRGSCDAAAGREGIAGVRVMLEDGSFAITDADGRYHFEGLSPGTHVVQADRTTLPGLGGQFIDCARSTRSAGAANSRLITGQGGSLTVVDFVAEAGADAVRAGDRPPASAISDAAAAGGETDFVAAGDGPIDWLFPAADHNPRAPAVRVAIRHRPGQAVELSSGGHAVEAVAFDGARTAPGGTFAVSTWRGIPLSSSSTHLTAVVRNADGSIAARLTRDVHFAATPARAEFLPARSRLIADGATRPVLAVRILDREGKPVHAGIAGELSVNQPYEGAAALEMLEARQSTGQAVLAPRWVVAGDDGVALIELAPTMVSGALHAKFAFADGQVRRSQTLDTWIVPGAQKWTLVGLAEGSLGEALRSAPEPADSDLGHHARVAFYAKGRVLGSALLTLAYDSAKAHDDQRLLGVIDPRAYYTVFADGSARRFDAASREKLYVRLESRAFYALYGDFETGFEHTQLGRYQRAATGLKGEAMVGNLQVAAFAAKVSSRHRRDELQGNGLSGPYRLSSRAIVANSETVTIERRDRFRSELVLERKPLARFLDYDIDALSGTITFSRPVLSRDADLNPQFIIVDYESDQLGAGELNTGLRAAWTTADGAVRVGATAISDKGDGARTSVATTDLRVRVGAATELRGELGASRGAESTGLAWLLEAEHHDGRLDLVVYARSVEADFGVGQQSVAERGRRKLGLDARVALTKALSLVGSAWRDDSLSDAARREAAQLRAEWHGDRTDLRLGVASFHDRLADGRSLGSVVLEGGATERLLDNRLELDATTTVALSGTDSIDLPARHRLGARYALARGVKVAGTYEIADGDGIAARTARVGFELAPWSGGRFATSVGQQDIAEQGKRSFAAFGLAQSWQVTPHLTVDATLDANRVLGGFYPSRVINPDHPVASGGVLGPDGLLAEDFTAVTLGAGYRAGRWSATARGEYRDGERADRKGFVLGAIRQMGEGSVLGSSITWTRADGVAGAQSEVVDALVSAAWRPAARPLTALAKLEYRGDRVTGSTIAQPGPADFAALTASGAAASRRLLASVSTSWSPRTRDRAGLVQRSEVGLFVGARYGFDRYDEIALSGVSVLAGLDARLGLGERFEIGGSATVRAGRSDGTTSFAFGPVLGFSPAKDMLVSVGYNISGFRDRDFSAARATDRGLVAGIRLKFDAGSLAFLGLRQ